MADRTDTTRLHCAHCGLLREQTTIEWGSFSVRQEGVVVASGSGPYEDIQREAGHYAMMYAQDGPVEVKMRKLKPRVVTNG